MQTTMKKMGFLKKAFACFGMAILIFALGMLFPPLWFLLLGIPFMVFRYVAGGSCPACGSYVEVHTKTGGTVCRRCKARLKVNGLLLEEIR